MCIDMDFNEWQKIIPSIMQRLYEECVAMSGTISGEHGIGSAKKKYLPLAIDKNTLDLMKKLKSIFDPHHILNPGTIFDI